MGAIRQARKLGGWGTFCQLGGLAEPWMGCGRQSLETADEQRTEFTLWTIARSPLMLGANLTKLDHLTRSLITNREMIDINQKSWKSYPVEDLPPGFDHAQVWEALTGTKDRPRRYVAFFNLDGKAVTLHATWKQLGIGGKHATRSLWDGIRVPPSVGIGSTLPSHGSAIYSVE